MEATETLREKIGSLSDIAEGLGWVLLLVFGILCFAAEFVLDLTVGAYEGIPAFLFTVLLRCMGTGLILLLFAKGYRVLTKSVHSQVLSAALFALCLCLLCFACALMWKNPALDLLDGMQTEQVELSNIRLEADDDYSSSVFYKIRGRAADGQLYIFSVNRKTFNQYKSSYKQNSGLVMKVNYLKHTQIVMGLTEIG